MTNHVSVLIVGAGPTGLTLACELARQGISFRIIDKKPERTLSSNATWIQSRTLEILKHMGIIQRFFQVGNRCHAINLYVDGKSLFKIPLNNVDSVYPFVLMVPQSETEHLLETHLNSLGGKVERSCELVDIKQANHQVTSQIKKDDKKEELTSDWLVACDGANSTVREKCHLSFPGEDLSEQFVVADAQIDSYLPKDEVHAFFDEGTLFAVFPLAKNKFRITANLHLEVKRQLFTEKEVIEMAQERAHGAYYVKSVSWISPFWVHGKVLSKMRVGSIFFAGDSAHIHSPAGSQGMNTGIQDAYNLAWKLAMTIKGKAKPALLESYQAERLPVAKQVVKQNESYTKMAFDKSFLSKLRRFVLHLLRTKHKLSKVVTEQLTQLSIKYSKSPAISYSRVSAKHLAQGLRAPDVIIDVSTHLYDYWQNAKHNVVLFTGSKISKKNIEKLQLLKEDLTRLYGDWLEVQVVAREKIPQIKDAIIDSSGVIHERYQAKQALLYVIRPDAFIAFCSKNLDINTCEKFFRKYIC